MGDMEELGTEFEAEVKVEVQVAPAFADTVPREYLRRVVEQALRHEERSGEVTVVVTDEQGIRELNRDFLGRDEVTDVLSFAAQEAGGPFVPAPEAGDYLGDVIICYPRAVEQAQDQGHPADQELALLVVHGVLHLLGYDHAIDQEQAEMWAVQDEILGQF